MTVHDPDAMDRAATMFFDGRATGSMMDEDEDNATRPGLPTVPRMRQGNLRDMDRSSARARRYGQAKKSGPGIPGLSLPSVSPYSCWRGYRPHTQTPPAAKGHEMNDIPSWIDRIEVTAELGGWVAKLIGDRETQSWHRLANTTARDSVKGCGGTPEEAIADALRRPDAYRTTYQTTRIILSSGEAMGESDSPARHSDE